MRKFAYILTISLLLASCEFFGVDVNPDSGNNNPDTIPTGSILSEDTVRNPDYLYDINSLPEITVTITEANWNQYLKNYDENSDNDIYVPAAFTFTKGDNTFYRDSVGLRPRGNTSRRRPEGNVGEMHQKENAQWHHAHFGVKFTEYVTGQRFFGSDRIVLKWFNNDPTYVREVYCYDLFRRFGVWTAPRVSYCKLYVHVNGDSQPAYFGIYAMIEGIQKAYIIDRRKDELFPDDTGNLWKARYTDMGGADLSSADYGKMGVSDDRNNYPYDLKTNEKLGLDAAKAELAAFINNMTPKPSGSQELKTWLNANMDVDLFLRAQAVNVMVGMWDDYWINQNNYYFYFDTNHKFYFIPYDYDNSLGTGNEGFCNPGTKDPMNWGSRGGDRMLIRKVLSIPEFEAKYKAYLQELAAGEFSYEASTARIRAWQQMVEPYLANDTYEDEIIEDRPAGWGSFHNYRLLSGGVGNGKDTESNFFRTKIASIPQ